MKTKLLLTIVIAFAAGALYAADVPPVGSAAPDFSAPDASGKTQSLSQYKGKYVVLEWFNPECPFVKKHYGSDNMQKLQAEYTGQGGFQRPNQTLRLPHNLQILVRWNALSLTRFDRVRRARSTFSFQSGGHLDRRFCFAMSCDGHCALRT